MYKDTQKTQSDGCLICFEPLMKEPSIIHFFRQPPLCQSCLNRFEIIDYQFMFHSYPLRILYRYNDFFRELLFRYKGMYDYPLKDAFLYLYNDELKEYYKDYIIVVAPSSVNDNNKRGFSPIEHIALSFSSFVFTGLYKSIDYKQSSLNYDERLKNQKNIAIKNGEILTNRKVLILDDVITSSSTLMSCLNLVLRQNPKHVEILILATKKYDIDFVFD